MKIVEAKSKTVNFLKLKPGTVFKVEGHNVLFIKAFPTEKAFALDTGVLVTLSDSKVIPYENAVLYLNNEV